VDDIRIAAGKELDLIFQNITCNYSYPNNNTSRVMRDTFFDIEIIGYQSERHSVSRKDFRKYLQRMFPDLIVPDSVNYDVHEEHPFLYHISFNIVLDFDRKIRVHKAAHNIPVFAHEDGFCVTHHIRTVQHAVLGRFAHGLLYQTFDLIFGYSFIRREIDLYRIFAEFIYGPVYVKMKEFALIDAMVTVLFFTAVIVVMHGCRLRTAS
jgi:hypothetical protein